MKRAGAVLIGLAAAAVSGCSALQAVMPRAEPVAASMPGQLEPVRAAAVVNDLTVFWVTSNGCTTKDSLLPVVSVRGGASVVSLRRISEDRCVRPVDDGIEVRWSFEELGLKPGANVTIDNPYQLSPDAG